MNHTVVYLLVTNLVHFHIDYQIYATRLDIAASFTNLFKINASTMIYCSSCFSTLRFPSNYTAIKHQTQ